MALEKKSEDGLSYSKLSWGERECLYQISLQRIGLSRYFPQDTNVNLLVTQEEKSGNHQHHQDTPSGYHEWLSKILCQ